MTVPTSMQGFDSEVYLTETLPELFRDAQTSAARVTSSRGELYTVTPMTTKRALMTWLSQAPSMKLWEGERHIKRNSGNDFTIVAEKYEVSLTIDADDLDDAAEVTDFSEQVRAAGESAGQHPDQLIWDFMANQGEVALGYDGVPLFATNHPTKDGQTYSNLEAGAETPWYLLDTTARAKGLLWGVRKDYTPRTVMAGAEGNVNGYMTNMHHFGVDARVVVAPGVPNRIWKDKRALDEANLKDALEKMASFKGDAGRPISVNPSVLMVPPSLWFAARDLVNRTLINGGESNSLQGIVDVVMNPWLA